MPLIAPLTDEKAGDAKATFQALQAKFRMVPNIFRTMGHASDVLNATLALDGSTHGDLDPKLHELVYLRTSQLNNCHY